MDVFVFMLEFTKARYYRGYKVR